MNTNIEYKSEMSDKQLLMVQNEYEDKKKSPVVMWLLWLFGGGIGLQRFYLRDKGMAFGMIAVNLITTIFTFGLVILTWLVIDAFLINKRLRLLNAEIEREIIRNVKIMTEK